ncbi:MAG: hypothetical protein K8R21_13525, partial [Leptospira sp.]|nr:hypothetical protein [Leptospira sp.]
MTNQKLFGFQHYRVVLFLLLSFCSRPPATATKAELSSYQSAYDLTRLVGEAEYSGPDFQEETDLAYHWKKNPGRYSSLAEKKKWQNTQVTFNTDKRLFINQSLDSILFLPDSNYRFRIEPGEYLFESFTGLLPLNGQDLVTSGTLELLS